jgi:hypothetical protein
MEKNSKIGLTAGAFMACSGAASGATVTQIRTLTGPDLLEHPQLPGAPTPCCRRARV